MNIVTFTDPNCPWAYFAEASRLALRWTYGDQIHWSRAYVVIAEHVGQSEATGFTPEVEAEEDRQIAVETGMPLWTDARKRITTSLRPSLAAVAARSLDAEEPLLRALWRRSRALGEAIDEPLVLRAAVEDAGVDSDRLAERMRDPAVMRRLRQEMEAARTPAAPARHLRHKLGGRGTRYSSPSWELQVGDRTLVAPGFQPLESYETLLANHAPELKRADPPERVEQVLSWAAMPLATAEVAAVARRPLAAVRAELEAVADFAPAGSDGFWAAREIA